MADSILEKKPPTPSREVEINDSSIIAMWIVVALALAVAGYLVWDWIRGRQLLRRMEQRRRMAKEAWLRERQDGKGS